MEGRIAKRTASPFVQCTINFLIEAYLLLTNLLFSGCPRKRTAPPVLMNGCCVIMAGLSADRKDRTTIPTKTISTGMPVKYSAVRIGMLHPCKIVNSTPRGIVKNSAGCYFGSTIFNFSLHPVNGFICFGNCRSICGIQSPSKQAESLKLNILQV